MPEKPDAFQLRFWALFSQEAQAVGALREAEARGGDVGDATAVRVRARVVLEAFVREHPDRAFAVFRPEHIARAFDSTITPLFEDGR